MISYGPYWLSEYTWLLLCDWNVYSVFCHGCSSCLAVAVGFQYHACSTYLADAVRLQQSYMHMPIFLGRSRRQDSCSVLSRMENECMLSTCALELSVSMLLLCWLHACIKDWCQTKHAWAEKHLRQVRCHVTVGRGGHDGRCGCPSCMANPDDHTWAVYFVEVVLTFGYLGMHICSSKKINWTAIHACNSALQTHACTHAYVLLQSCHSRSVVRWCDFWRTVMSRRWGLNFTLALAIVRAQVIEGDDCHCLTLRGMHVRWFMYSWNC